MNNITLSIIIPVYNTEKYINKCVNSILLNCDIYNIELLLIDDGSSDNSGEICDNLKANDRRIKVFHKKNEGLSSARNYGLDRAKGRYITFVDSDDYVSSKYINDILMMIKTKADLYVFSYAFIYENSNEIIEYSLNNKKGNIKDLIKELENKNSFNSVCNKIYKLSIINKKPILRFENNADPGEDLMFNCDYCIRIDETLLISESLYNYVRRDEDTLANKFRKDLYIRNNRCIEKRKWFYNKLQLTTKNDIKNLYKGNFQYIFVCIPNMYRKKHRFPIKERLAFYETILNNNELKDWISVIDDHSVIFTTFKCLYKTKSKYIIDLFYSIIMTFRNNFKQLWIKKRTSVIYENNN